MPRCGVHDITNSEEIDKMSVLKLFHVSTLGGAVLFRIKNI